AGNPEWARRLRRRPRQGFGSISRRLARRGPLVHADLPRPQTGRGGANQLRLRRYKQAQRSRRRDTDESGAKPYQAGELTRVPQIATEVQAGRRLAPGMRKRRCIVAAPVPGVPSLALQASCRPAVRTRQLRERRSTIAAPVPGVPSLAIQASGRTLTNVSG